MKKALIIILCGLLLGSIAYALGVRVSAFNYPGDNSFCIGYRDKKIEAKLNTGEHHVNQVFAAVTCIEFYKRLTDVRGVK